MSRFGRVCAFLISAGWVSAECALAQTKLELQFQPDKTVRQQMIQTTKIEATPPGKNDFYTTQIDQSWLMESKAGKVQDDGSAELRQHFSQIGMTIQLPSKRISVDTAKPLETEDRTEKNIQEAVSKVLGLDWLITLQKNGAVRKVALSEELSDLLVDNPQVGPLADTFTESGLRKMSEQTTVTFPAKPVAKGDQWEQSVTNEFPDGKLITQRTCTFDGTVEDGLLRISVKLSATFQPAKSARQQMELTSNGGSGEVHFDPRIGQVVRSKFQQNLVLKVGPMDKQAIQKIQMTSILLPAEEPVPEKKQ